MHLIKMSPRQSNPSIILPTQSDFMLLLKMWVFTATQSNSKLVVIHMAFSIFKLILNYQIMEIVAVFIH